MDELEKGRQSAVACKFIVSYDSKDVQTNLCKTQNVLTTQHAAVDASTCALNMCIQLDPGDCSKRAELNQKFQRQSLKHLPEPLLP